MADPAGLGRGPLTRRLPMLWQAPAQPPRADAFTIAPEAGSRRFLLSVMFSVKRFSIPALALGIAWQAGEALVPVVMGAAIDRALATGDWQRLLIWLAVLAAVFVMLSLGFRLATQLVEYATEIVQHRLRITLSREVLHADRSDAPRPDGGTVSLMTNDVARTAAIGLTMYPVAEFAGIIIIASTLLFVHWPLGLIVLAGVPAAVWLMGLLSGRLAQDSRKYQTLLAGTVGRASDLVSGYRVIKGIRADAEASRRYRLASRETLAGAYRNVGLLGRFLVGSNTVSGAFVGGVAALAAWFAVEGQITIGELIAAVGLAQALLPPMRMVAMNAVPAWANARASSARIFDALQGSHTSPRRSGRNGGRAVDVDSRLRLSVDGHRAIDLDCGEMIGVLATERTAASVIDVLLSPESSTINRGSYRARVTVSPHHATLFSGTVGQAFVPDHDPGTASDSVTEKSLLAKALHTAACDDFISSGEDADREIGEMGNRLSGGQRQRLALARALAAFPPVLVLHDPTTAVDSVTEQTIAGRLPAARAGRSTIVITASPPLLGVCDRIVDLREPTESQPTAEGPKDIQETEGADV
ncbi:ABC transporter ATP-binding protein [Brevibacterium aurantiacum]|nr:ABC transporter ATP-binding protein [Brevibacterium aurantiacum]